MTNQSNHTKFSKAFIGMAILCSACIYSCNDSANEVNDDEKKDTVTIQQDTMMQMRTDTMVTDTLKKGGQPTPTGH